jgi:hypothetical protein
LLLLSKVILVDCILVYILLLMYCPWSMTLLLLLHRRHQYWHLVLMSQPSLSFSIYLCSYYIVRTNLADLDTSLSPSLSLAFLLMWHLRSLSWQQHVLRPSTERKREKRERRNMTRRRRHDNKETEGQIKQWLDQQGLLSINRSRSVCVCEILRLDASGFYIFDNKHFRKIKIKKMYTIIVHV